MLELQNGEYGNPLKQFQKDAMLDLVLAWGSLDGALTMLVAAFTGEELHAAADRIGKLKGELKLLEISKILENYDEATEIAKNFRRQKKQYEKFAKPRNRIAHAHCVGFLLSDDQFVVFACTECVGEDKMAIEAIPIEAMLAATKYGQTLTAFAYQTAEKFRSAS